MYYLSMLYIWCRKSKRSVSANIIHHCQNSVYRKYPKCLDKLQEWVSHTTRENVQQTANHFSHRWGKYDGDGIADFSQPTSAGGGESTWYNPLDTSSNSGLTLILRRSRMGTVWFYTSTSNKRAARPKLYTKSLTRDLKHMYSLFTLVRISINL